MSILPTAYCTVYERVLSLRLYRPIATTTNGSLVPPLSIGFRFLARMTSTTTSACVAGATSLLAAGRAAS
jgi:hypothetical protein